MVDGIGSGASYKSAHKLEQGKSERTLVQNGNLFASQLEAQDIASFEFSTLQDVLTRPIPLEIGDIIISNDSIAVNNNGAKQYSNPQDWDSFEIDAYTPHPNSHATFEELESIDLSTLVKETQSQGTFANKDADYFDVLDSVVKNAPSQLSFLSLNAPHIREAVKIGLALKEVEEELISKDVFDLATIELESEPENSVV